MASMQDMKRRREGIRKIHQMTKAMQLVSTVKFQKTRKQEEKTRAYFRYAARRSTKKLRDPFLTDDTEEGTPQATPSKQPYGTRKAPFSAASSPT